VDAKYNFMKNGQALADGAPVSRRFADDTYEMYAQDSWKVKTNLTLTFGLRYSLFGPPWETNGLQVSSTRSLSDYFNSRGTEMLQGVPANAQPPLTFDLGGPANHAPGFYDWGTKNFGPHVAFAWSPHYSSGFLHSLFGDGDKTTIRGGFAIVYDRLGPQLLATFDTDGSFGLSTTLTNTGGIQTPATAPRATCLSGINCIPKTDNTGPKFPADLP